MTHALFKTALLGLSALGLSAPAAMAEASIFELRITNNTNSDLTFRLDEDHTKHARLTYNKKSVNSHTIKAGTYDIVGVQPTGAKCDPKCGFCTPTKTRVYAWYKDSSGKDVRNNYYKTSVEFSEYCGVAGSKPITTYTSNWAFDHHQGKGTNHFKHSQKSSHNNYTKSSPAQGLTVDGNHIHGHATITYSN